MRKKGREELENEDDKNKNAHKPSIFRVRTETDEKNRREELENFEYITQSSMLEFSYASAKMK